VVFVAFKFDAAKAPAAEHVISNAHVHLVLFIDPRGQHFKKLLKFGFAGQERCQCEYYLFVIAWGSKD